MYVDMSVGKNMITMRTVSALTVGHSISRLGLVQAKRLYIPSSQKGNISGQGSAYSGRKKRERWKMF